MIIIGMGRVGQGISRRAGRLGIQHTTIDRDGTWSAIDPSGSGPILVAVNAPDIVDVARKVPLERQADLVLVQNGMIDPALESIGLAQNTRGLLYFAVPSRGVEPQPGGVSLFTGPHASEVTSWFQSIDLQAREVDRLSFVNEMMSKLIWNCVFGLLCDVHDCSVGALCASRMDDVSGLITELTTMSNMAGGTTLDAEDVCRSLCEYSLSIPKYQGTMKQWPWRNGWFVAAAAETGEPCALHAKFLVGRAPEDS